MLPKKNMSKPEISASDRGIIFIPGAFSHMSQLGALLGSAKPTRRCRLASLLHLWTLTHKQKMLLFLISDHFLNKSHCRLKKKESLIALPASIEWVYHQR